MSQPTNRIPNGAFLLARNWDRFGGRVSEILNCYYIAKKFGFNFRFIWPAESRFPEIDEMQKAFNRDFLNNYLITEESLEGIPRIHISLDGTLSTSSFLSLFREHTKPVAVTVSDFFRIPTLPGDEPEQVLREFAKTAESVWAPELIVAQSAMRPEFSNSIVVHARYGDLVTGAWKNFVEPSKYVTGRQVQGIILDNKRKNFEVVLISDSPEIQGVFKVLDKAPGLGDSLSEFTPENVETLADLFKMQFSQQVNAPAASAFSTLGAHLAAKEVQILSRRRHSSRFELESLIQSESVWMGMPTNLRGNFISRDLDQEINSLDGIYDVETFSRLARIAHEADPKNPTSMNHLAIGLSFRHRYKMTRTLIGESKKISLESFTTHHDPLYLSLLAEFTTLVIEISNFEWKVFLRKSDAVSKIENLKKIRVELEKLRPYQIDKNFAEATADEIIKVLELAVKGPFAILARLRLHRGNRRLTNRHFGYQESSLFVLNVLRSIVLEFD